MDLIGNFALPLPMTMITEILGVPTRDQRKFHKWSNVIVSANTFNMSWRVLPAMFMLTRYLRRFFKSKRGNPRDDLATALIKAEEAGENLNEDELLAMAVLLLIAGHETTVNLIGNGMLDLMQNPDQLDLLRQDPSLIPSAVEELLRYSAPVLMATERFPREPVTISGVTIPQGEITLAVLASANRDETVFRNPDKLDITRAANRHVAFGQGIHYCVGAPLARMEAQVALKALLRRLPAMRLKTPVESLRWRRSLILRGLESLPIKF
jgi:cytochrome P450 PksS